MKKKITTTILTLVAAFGFAQDAILEQVVPNLVQLEVKPALPFVEVKATPKKSFGYIRMGVSDSNLPSYLDQIVPGIGLGYRLASGSSAFDLSAGYNHRTYRTEEGKEHTYRYTAPKVNYLYYVAPASNNSLYAGGGLAWGGVVQDNSEFHGIVPNVAIGCEMNRHDSWRSFVQLDVSQPAVAANQKGAFPGPFAEISVGAGF